MNKIKYQYKNVYNKIMSRIKTNAKLNAYYLSLLIALLLIFNQGCLPLQWMTKRWHKFSITSKTEFNVFNQRIN